MAAFAAKVGNNDEPHNHNDIGYSDHCGVGKIVYRIVLKLNEENSDNIFDIDFILL